MRERPLFSRRLPDHPALKAILAWNPDALTDAKVRPRRTHATPSSKDFIRTACETLQAAGYNFFEDMTAVDWYPSVPRFQLSYHILSHAYKERIRLRVMVDEDRPVGRIHHPRLGRAPTITSAKSSICSASALKAIPTCAAS